MGHQSQTVPVLIVLAGPAGSGKTTLCERLVRSEGGFERVVTATTRPPREGERDGVDYHFSRFVPLISRGKDDPLAGWEQGTIWTPDDDSLCGDLVATGEALKRYSMAPPNDRDKIRAEIRAKVDRLETKLDQRGEEDMGKGKAERRQVGKQ